MANLLDIIKTIFGSKSQVRRCKVPNPTIDEAHDMPTKEALELWEHSYAGPHTQELLERHTA